MARKERLWAEGRREVGRCHRSSQLLLFSPHLWVHDFSAQDAFLRCLERLTTLTVSLTVFDMATAAASQLQQTDGWVARLKASSAVRFVRRCRWDDAECWWSVVAALSPAQLTAAELTVELQTFSAGDGFQAAEDLRWLAARHTVTQPPSAAAAAQDDWRCPVLLCPATRAPSSPCLVQISGRGTSAAAGAGGVVPSHSAAPLTPLWLCGALQLCGCHMQAVAAFTPLDTHCQVSGQRLTSDSPHLPVPLLGAVPVSPSAHRIEEGPMTDGEGREGAVSLRRRRHSCCSRALSSSLVAHWRI